MRQQAPQNFSPGLAPKSPGSHKGPFKLEVAILPRLASYRSIQLPKSGPIGAIKAAPLSCNALRGVRKINLIRKAIGQ